MGAKLNSATIAPRAAASGANIAAGYTTDDVPTTKQTSQVDIAVSVKKNKLLLMLETGFDFLRPF